MHWELSVDRPPVNRMEYLFELRHQDGRTETVLDPGNPDRADGAFGPKSVREHRPGRDQGPGRAFRRWLTCTTTPPGENLSILT